MHILSIHWLACLVVASSLFPSGAFAQNFYELAKKENCESVMDSLRGECNTLNTKKDGVCKMQGSCDLEKQIKEIAIYRADVKRLSSGEIAEADRNAFKESIEKMKAQLDARKQDATANERAARECADARQAVYDFFNDKVIPQTDRAAREAMDRREGLLEQLDKAEVLQRAAKDQRDKLAGVDPEKDKARWDEYIKMRDEYDKNAATYREVEARMAEANRKHGPDTDRNVQDMLKYYKGKQEGHKIEIEQQKDRSEKCGKLEHLSTDAQ